VIKAPPNHSQILTFSNCRIALKKLLILLLLISLPFLFITLVNAVSPSPTQQYLPGRCTRYCEAHGCLHFNYKFKNTDELLSKWWYQLYRWNVKMLNGMPFLNYHQANILMYFILYPLLMLVLLYRVLKD
jgi:hypothetical protein